MRVAKLDSKFYLWMKTGYNGLFIMQGLLAVVVPTEKRTKAVAWLVCRIA